MANNIDMRVWQEDKKIVQVAVKSDLYAPTPKNPKQKQATPGK